MCDAIIKEQFLGRCRLVGKKNVFPVENGEQIGANFTVGVLFAKEIYQQSMRNALIYHFFSFFQLTRMNHP